MMHGSCNIKLITVFLFFTVEECIHKYSVFLAVGKAVNLTKTGVQCDTRNLVAFASFYTRI